MNLELYENKIWEKGTGIFGKYDWREVSPEELRKIPLIKSFLDDDDIQEITVCSGNFGFVKTFQKRYKRK